jgi:hypothetical protein
MRERPAGAKLEPPDQEVSDVVFVSHHSPRESPPTRRGGLRRVIPSALIALTSVLAFTGLYTAAYKDPTPHEIPVAVVASGAVAGQIQAGLDRAEPDGFDVRHYAGEADARADLLDTEVQGVLVPGPAGDRALITGAFGKSPTDAVRTAFEQIAAARGAPLTVKDLRPLPSHDSRGMGAMWTVLGTVVPSITFGAMLTLLGGGLPTRTRWLTLAAFAPAAGLVSALTADAVVGALGGAFWPLVGVSTVIALGVAGAVHGLGRSFGLPGIGLGVLVLLVLGQASSGGAVTPLLVPDFYGAVAPWLPTGAGVSAVRNVVYFDGAAIAQPLMVLAGYGLLGLTLELVARLRPQWALGLPRTPRPAPAAA